MTDVVNLRNKLASFADLWSPKVVASLNGQQVRVAKLQGEYVWHRHADEDELFLVIAGRLLIHLRDRLITLEEGELYVVPRGVELKPEAPGECHVLLFEPATTRPTGDAEDPRGVEVADLERI
jgi:mannose-6-phosphate isomerase-like protein (cupin superfamily)